MNHPKSPRTHLVGVAGGGGGGSGMDILDGYFFKVYYPEIGVSFQNHKGEVLKESANTYRYKHTERCNWAIINLKLLESKKVVRTTI